MDFSPVLASIFANDSRWASNALDRDEPDAEDPDLDRPRWRAWGASKRLAWLQM